MLPSSLKLSRAATATVARTARLGLTSFKLSSSSPYRLIHDGIIKSPNANPVALQMIDYALSLAKSQKSDESHAQAMLVLEQCLSSQSSENQDVVTHNSKGMVLLAMSSLLSARGSYDDAMEKLQNIQDLIHTHLDVRVAAMEALVGLNLEMGNDDTSSVLADKCLELLGKVELKNSDEDSEVASARAKAIKGLAELVQGNVESAEPFFQGFLDKTPSPTSSPTPPTTKTPFPSSNSTLNPKQLRALQSLDIPTAKDPCIQPSPHNATICDSSSPFRQLVSLHLSNCSSDLSLSYTALKSLSTLQSLSFTNCPVTPIRFPLDLAISLHSFTCIHSLKHLTGIGLSRFVNLTDLTVSNVPVNTSGLYAVLGNMRKLRSVTISNANVTGYIPKHLLLNLTQVDFSGNRLKGKIPSSITLLENLESLNLYSNALTGAIPDNLGDLISLKNVSLGSNSLSGAIPDSMSAIPDLAYVDLSSNQLNGTVPKFFAEMKKLRYLNLENNGFHGVLPFNLTFMKRLDVFKVGGNSNLCYNHTILSSKLKLGIAPCDKHGLPLSPPAAKDNSSGGDSESDSSDYNDEGDDSNSKKEGHHGPNKVVLGVAIALSSIVFLIVFLILLSKRCG